MKQAFRVSGFKGCSLARFGVVAKGSCWGDGLSKVALQSSSMRVARLLEGTFVFGRGRQGPCMSLA